MALFTDSSGEHGAVGVVLEAKSPSEVEVTVGDLGDLGDELVTTWIDPSTVTVRGHHVTSCVTPAYQG